MEQSVEECGLVYIRREWLGLRRSNAVDVAVYERIHATDPSGVKVL